MGRGWMVWVVAAVTVAGCCCRREDPDPGINVPVVDVHAHFFNARDLPVAGILEAFGAPDGVARSLAAVLHWWTPDDDEADAARATEEGVRAPTTMPATDDARRVADLVRGNLRRNRRSVVRESLLAPLTPAEQEELMRYAGETAASRATRAPATDEGDEFEVRAVAKALLKAGFPPPEHGEAARRFDLGHLGGYVRFLGVVTRSRSGIARQALEGEYPSVRLFVHHMMDLEKAYASRPAVEFAKQSGVMKRVDGRFGGRLVRFVAFDPFRRGDALESVKKGIEAGALGVKFYPPSGYSATGNQIDPRPAGDGGDVKRWDSRYAGLSGEELDRINDGLFRYCVEKDLPIFTHCTPGGFEAVGGYGGKSDPKYWATVLERHPGLRLCFGHSGGDAFWFSPAGTTGDSFGGRVVELCLKYPKVYCEVGYLAQILDEGPRGVLRERLAGLMERRSADGGWRFGEKIMYGSDWYMIAQEKHPETYLRDFWGVFEDGRLRGWRGAFFGGNAVRYLRLAEVVAGNDGRFTDEQRGYWGRVVEETKDAGRTRRR